MTKEIIPPKLDSIDMRGNLIKNGAFKNLKGWNQIHKSNTNDTFSIKWKQNHIIFERAQSESDGGTLGVSQNIDAIVSKYKSLILSLDVWIDYHTLKDTGKWAKKHGGLGELPLMISMKYQDVNDILQVWNYGFITKSGRVDDSRAQINISYITKRKWHHYDINILSDSVRRDSSGKVLPRPKKILQVNVYGKGWDFRGAIGNLKLSSKVGRVKGPAKSTNERKTQERKGQERKGQERKGQERKTQERKGQERKIQERKTQERKVQERKTQERKVQERKTPSPIETKSISLKLQYDRVYVDASNVAHGIDSKIPSVHNIILIHDKLKNMGFARIIIIADASLRHKIDEKDTFEKLIDEGMVSQAPAKTAADEFIIGFAKQKLGYIVTNDKLEDWKKKDPWVKENIDELHIQFMIQEDMVQFVGFPS